MSDPICYHDVERILEKLTKDKPNAADSVIRFFRSNKLFDERKADYTPSLIMLKAGHCRIRADLNISPNLKDLPPISRTGRESPRMRAYLLGLKGDVVTDPYLQRARCLFITKQAAIEEWINLLFEILKMVAMMRALLPPPKVSSKTSQEDRNWLDPLREATASTSEKWLNPLCDTLELWYEAIPRARRRRAKRGNGGAGDLPPKALREKLVQFLKARLRLSGIDKLPEHAERYLDMRLNKLRVQQDPKSDVIVHDFQLLLENLLIVLRYTLNDAPDKWRHLGRDRLSKIIRFAEPLRDFNLVIQGAGDLSMNERNVAFYRDDRDEPQVFLPATEPFASRTYNCLIVWKKDDSLKDEIEKAIRFINSEDRGISLEQDLSIAPLRFSPGGRHIELTNGHSESPPIQELQKLVEFAVYGKLVLKTEKNSNVPRVLEPVEIVDEFQDLRHIFLLPSINPEDRDVQDALNSTAESLARWVPVLKDLKRNIKDRNQLFSHLAYDFIKLYKQDSSSEQRIINAEKIWQWVNFKDGPDDVRSARKKLQHKLDEIGSFLVGRFSELRRRLKRPRYTFGQLQTTDVWLLEYALLSDRSLRHLACDSTVAVNLSDLGAPKVWVDFCLLLKGYRKRDHLSDIRDSGDFAWDESDYPRLNIRLKMNTYPCTVVGIGNLDSSPKNDTLYLLAWGHEFSRGHTIKECAEMLKAAGARYALVIDEGQDVFQCYIPGRLSVEANDNFLPEEERCESLDRWMPVPIAFGIDSKNNLKTLTRRSLRATLAFWQQSK